MQSPSYQEKLTKGKEIEVEFAALLAVHYRATAISYNNDHRYDIMAVIADKQYTFEIKEDKKSSETDYVAVEFMVNGHNSGIRTSDAFYWVYKIDGDFWLIRRAKLLEKIWDFEFDKIVTGGEPENVSQLYLVHKWKFKSWCKQMFDKENKQ